MRRWVAAFVAGSVLAAAGPVTSQSAPEPVSDGVAFHVDLPEGVLLTRQAIIDFDIYQVTVDRKPIVGFYEGFAANVGDWVADRRSGRRQQRERSDGGADFFWSRDCTPPEVHGWVFADLSDAEAARAHAIVESVRMRSCE